VRSFGCGLARVPGAALRARRANRAATQRQDHGRPHRTAPHRIASHRIAAPRLRLHAATARQRRSPPSLRRLAFVPLARLPLLYISTHTNHTQYIHHPHHTHTIHTSHNTYITHTIHTQYIHHTIHTSPTPYTHNTYITHTHGIHRYNVPHLHMHIHTAAELLKRREICRIACARSKIDPRVYGYNR